MKTGVTFPVTLERFGDFDNWTAQGLRNSPFEIRSVDVLNDVPFPSLEDCAGIVITGSHAMVTDNLPWSVKLENWLKTLLREKIPIFGICYGHQLLARAAGGRVGFHPKGKEIGTVVVEMLSGFGDDPIFGTFPSSFLAHVTHAQSVLELPDSAVRIAGNAFESNHAIRIEKYAYGVQFHPEYTGDIMRSYILEQSETLVAAGHDIESLLAGVQETPLAASALEKFCGLIKDRA